MWQYVQGKTFAKHWHDVHLKLKYIHVPSKHKTIFYHAIILLQHETMHLKLNLYCYYILLRDISIGNLHCFYQLIQLESNLKY